MIHKIVDTESTKLFMLDIDNYQNEINHISSLLPLRFNENILRYKTESDRLQRFAGYYLLNKLIDAFELTHKISLQDLKRNENNKPFFEFPFYFSIAHVENKIVCIASNKNSVGVDIEIKKEYPEILLGDYFTNDEIIKINLFSSDKIINFLVLWTKKEALAKAIGLGISLPFKEIEVLQKAIRLNNKKYEFENYEIENNLIIATCIETCI